MKSIKLNFKNQKSYTRQGEEVYYTKILDEAIKKMKEGRAVFYSEEEFWRIIQEGEFDYYGRVISNNI